MKRFNILYILVIGVVAGLYYLNENYVHNRTTFYGFAENKETEINLDEPVLINAIYVATGQSVSKGDLLMEVSQLDLEQKIDAVQFDIQTQKLGNQTRRLRIQSEIAKLKAERNEKVGEIETEIETLKSEIKLNQSMLKDLKSISIDTTLAHPNEISIAAKQQEIRLVVEPIDVQIQNLEKELLTINAPTEVAIQKLEQEQFYHKKEQERLMIYAPKDGLIGTIHCKEGENISSFMTLISFYERNPTLVKGYVHESLILHVNVEDSLDIASSLHPSQTSSGKVMGLGSRIVEVPERLRKIPEIKSYGREVMIQIPADNSFLQKEKVVLTLRNSVSKKYIPSWRTDRQPTTQNAEQASQLKR